MKKTRKECREETGYEPEDISKLAKTHSRWNREQRKWTHSQKTEWVYEGLKHQHSEMQKKSLKKASDCEEQSTFEIKKASDLMHNCTGSASCLGCERDRRNAYADGGNYY